jgi:hypothetical protein
VDYRLVHTSMIFLGNETKLGIQISGEAQRHSHTTMVATATNMVHNHFWHCSYVCGIINMCMPQRWLGGKAGW